MVLIVEDILESNLYEDSKPQAGFEPVDENVLESLYQLYQK
jgi:hypothetical protein